MPGSGKSTVAPLLAEHLGIPADDLDRRVSEAAGMEVAEIFELEDEIGFRRRERDELAAVVEAGHPVVLSTGGGVVTCEGSRQLLAHTTCVWLTASREHLAARVEASDEVRPLLAGDVRGRLDELAVAREPLYREVSTHVVETDDLEAAAVASEIAGLLS
jgi:shikimate kinase